jgi:hypothetical protein
MNNQINIFWVDWHGLPQDGYVLSTDNGAQKWAKESELRVKNQRKRINSVRATGPLL